LCERNEHFSVNGRELPLTMADFQHWAYSGFGSNASRSVLAEYIVATALGISDKLRNDSMGSVLMDDGRRVKVSTAAYIQSCDEEHPERIAFNMACGNNPDISIFCVYTALMADESPLNLDLWEFYVLPSEILNTALHGKQTITLPHLLKLEPLWSDYYGLKEAVRMKMSA